MISLKARKKKVLLCREEPTMNTSVAVRRKTALGKKKGTNINRTKLEDGIESSESAA